MTDHSEIRQAFMRGVVSVHGEAPEPGVLEEKVARVAGRRPDDAVPYAFTAGRNWAVGRARARDFRARQVLEAAEREAAARREAARQEAFRDQARAVASRMEEAGLAGRKPLLRYADVLRLAYVNGTSASAWAGLYPELSRDGLYKIRQRAVLAAAEWASPELMAWFSERRWRR